MRNEDQIDDAFISGFGIGFGGYVR